MLPNEINLTIVFLVSETYNNETNQEGGKEKNVKKKQFNKRKKPHGTYIFDQTEPHVSCSRGVNYVTNTTN